MIFARGVRFIRFMSSSVRGRLSGSLTAAACFSASVIASRRLQSCFAAVFLAVLFMILASLVSFCLACGDNPHLIPPQRVGDDQEAPLHHAKKNQARFAVIFTVIYGF